jgi:hypothetical protein
MRLERLLLPTAAIEGEHVLRAKVLAVGLGCDQLLQPAQQLLVEAECQLRVVSQLDRVEAQRIEPPRLPLVDQLTGEIGERRAAPQPQRGEMSSAAWPGRPSASARRAAETSRSNRCRSTWSGAAAKR